MSDKDFGSIEYITKRASRVSEGAHGRTILEQLTTALIVLMRYPRLKYSFLLPTETGLSKGILDSVKPMRDFLKDAGLHDFALQRQGIGNKVTLDGCIITENDTIQTPMSLYRPNTKTGDPRVWFFKLNQYVLPWSLLAIVTDGYTVYALDCSTDVLNNPETSVILARCNSDSNLTPFESELLDRLRSIGHKGWVPSIKHGDTAVGMTLEHELGISPNSDRGPDWNGIELKCQRVGNNSRHVLFAEKPNWGLSAYNERELLDTFGYWDEKNKRTSLYSTIYGNHRNPQGFLLKPLASEDEMTVQYESANGTSAIEEVSVWEMEKLRTHLRNKHAHTFWIEAETRRASGKEEFHYIAATLTRNPDYMQLENLISQGHITQDFTMHLAPATGRGKADINLPESDPRLLKPRDHGFIWKADGTGMRTLFGNGDRYNLQQ